MDVDAPVRRHCLMTSSSPAISQCTRPWRLAALMFACLWVWGALICPAWCLAASGALGSLSLHQTPSSHCCDNQPTTTKGPVERGGHCCSGWQAIPLEFTHVPLLAPTERQETYSAPGLSASPLIGGHSPKNHLPPPLLRSLENVSPSTHGYLAYSLAHRSLAPPSNG